MGVVFEQPQPIDIGAAYGSGLRDAMEKDRAFALQAWKAQADQLNEQQKLGQQAYQFEAGRMPSQRDVFATQADFARLGMQQDYGREIQDAQQAQQLQLQQNDFTYRDKRDLDRLNNNRAQARAMARLGIFDQSDVANYEAAVTPEINALQIREAQTRQRQINQHLQQESEIQSRRMAQMDSLQRERERAEAANGPSGTFQLPDPANPDQNFPGLYRRNPQTGHHELVPGTDIFPDGPRMREFFRPDGTVLRGIETRPGHFMWEPPQRPQRGEITPQYIARLRQQVTNDVNREYQQALRANGNQPLPAGHRLGAQADRDALVNQIVEQHLAAARAGQAAPPGATAPPANFQEQMNGWMGLPRGTNDPLAAIFQQAGQGQTPQPNVGAGSPSMPAAPVAAPQGVDPQQWEALQRMLSDIAAPRPPQQ